MNCRYISELSQEEAIKSFLGLLNRKPEDCLTIDGLLEEIGLYFQSDRTYIFEEEETGKYLKNTFEWCNEGVNPEILNLQSIPINVINIWKNRFRIRGSFYSVIDEVFKKEDPEVYAILAPHQINSLLVAPLVLGGQITGLFGIDNPKTHIDYLLLVSVMASSLFKEILSIREVEQSKIAEAKLKNAMEAAQTANKAKSDFLFNMSHDIRTPMNAIVGYNSLIKKEINNPEKILHYQEQIEWSSEFLLSLINDVLDMARIESGKATLDEEYYDVTDTNNAIVSVFENEAKKRNISFSFEADIEHKHVLCDLTKMRQIYANLLSNSIKYTPAGGKISVTIKEIDCDKNGYTTFKTIFKDNGVGISEDFLPHIFEAFSREHNSTTSGIAGTGLGMAIVKNLVELMNGTIEVESKVGVGTTFVITTTHKIADKSYYQKSNQQNINFNLLHFEGKRVLLAEDNDMNAEIVATILESLGLQVGRAQDGVACVDMLNKASENYYNMILMDIQMPRMDGYKATQTIRSMKEDWKKNIPIIALTANAFAEDKKKGIRFWNECPYCETN